MLSRTPSAASPKRTRATRSVQFNLTLAETNSRTIAAPAKRNVQPSSSRSSDHVTSVSLSAITPMDPSAEGSANCGIRNVR
jgi:hypothetical protein